MDETFYSHGNIIYNNEVLTLPKKRTNLIGVDNNGSLIVGNVKIESTVVSTDAYRGALIVNGGAGILGNVNIGEGIGTGGNVNVGGNVIVSGNLFVGNTTNISWISGVRFLNGDVSMNAVSASGDVIVNSTTESTSTDTGALRISGGVGIAKRLFVGGTSTLTTVLVNSNTESTSTDTGALRISGGVGIAKNLFVGGTSTLTTVSASGLVSASGGIFVTSTTESTSTDTGALRISGGVGIGKRLNVGENLVVESTDNPSWISGVKIVNGEITASVITGSSSSSQTTSISELNTGGPYYITYVNGFTGSLAHVVNKGFTFTPDNKTLNVTNLDISGIITVNGVSTFRENVPVTSTTESTSTDTGALRISGGVGIAKNLFVGGTLILTTVLVNSTTESISTDTGALRILGGVGIGKNLVVGGTLFFPNVSSKKIEYVGVNSNIYTEVQDGGATFRHVVPITTNHRFMCGTTDEVIIDGNKTTFNNNIEQSGTNVIFQSGTGYNELKTIQQVGTNFIYQLGTGSNTMKSIVQNDYNAITQNGGNVANNFRGSIFNGWVYIKDTNRIVFEDTDTPTTSSSILQYQGGCYLDNNATNGGKSFVFRIWDAQAGLQERFVIQYGGVTANQDFSVKGTFYIGTSSASSIQYSSSSMIFSIPNLNSFKFNNSNAGTTPVQILASSENATNTTSGTLRVIGGVGISQDVHAQSFNATSDYRIKDNVISLHDISCNTDVLRPIRYTNALSNHEDFGFIAHELQEVFPQLVNGVKDGKDYQTVNYLGLIPILTKEIQQLKNEIKNLKKEVQQIKDDVLILKKNE